MAKVVTSQGLTEFVQSGKFDTVVNHKAGQKAEPAPLEAVKVAPTVDVSPAGAKSDDQSSADTKGSASSHTEGAKGAGSESEHDEPLTDEEKTLPEKAQKEIQRAKRAVNKKHAEMMAAKDELAELERFGEVQFNEKRQLEQKVNTLETQLEQLKQKAQPPEPELTKPNKDDPKYRNEKGEFDWEKFSEDQATFVADKAVKDERTRQAQERASEQNKQLLARHTASEAEAKKAHKDFDTVMSHIQGTELDKPPGFVLGFLNDSDLSGEMRYYLATHPDETKKIFELPPIRGIKELGKIEDQLIKPSTVAKETPATSGAIPRGAPPPITPLNGEGSSGIQTDPSKMSFKELREYERARRREKH